jgi:predicted phosphodiesterase
MRYAVISDIHANQSALRSVLVDAHDLGAEKIICLGDVLGYGPEPVEALETIYREAHICLAGNHDDAIAGRISAEDFTEFASSAVDIHRTKLAHSALDWLRHLPYTCELSNFACAHGDFSDPKNFNYILSVEDAEPSFSGRSEQLLFVGHTHEPTVFVKRGSGEIEKLEATDFTIQENERYIVNPGSVGYPRHGVCRSFYCIYDDILKTISFRSLPFDIESYREKMHGKGMDEAPWLSKKALMSLRPSVRSKVEFSKKEKRTLKTSVPNPIEMLIADKKVSAVSRLAPALILSAIIISLVGLYCTVRLTKQSRVSAPSVRIVETPKVELKGEGDKSSFKYSIPLSGNWSAFYENENEQKVRIERNKKSGETAFRISHKKMHSLRFMKKLTLVSKPEKVYTNIRLLTKKSPGKKEAFSFTGRLIFFDDKGSVVGEEFMSGKQSCKRSTQIPESAYEVVFMIDCRCNGEYDLAIPYFDTEKEREKKKR